MLQPMEMLSQTTTRTDSGSGVRQRQGSGLEDKSSRFDRMFEEELSKYDNKPLNNTNTEDEGKNVKPAEEQNNEQRKNNADEALAAGVMGNLMKEVVFILEGDNESTTFPELRVEPAAQQPPETTQIVNPEQKPEITEEITTETQQFTQMIANAETAATKQETAVNTEANIETTGVTGDVMARRPDIRTKDSQENAENNSKSSENGNLSPLENKNEETQRVGQNEKTYSEAANAVKKALNNEKSAENKPEPTISTNEIVPPLSEGIKAQQFSAAQQMTQAALSTPVKPENLFEEMINRVELMQNDTKSTMTIQLNPEFLGKVALEVAVDAAGLHVKINAEDSGVRSMINGQLTALLESLESKGIAVAEVEVIYTGINNGAFKEPGENEQHQSRNYKPANREVKSTDAVAYYTTLPDLFEFYQETGISSVEYRA